MPIFMPKTGDQKGEIMLLAEKYVVKDSYYISAIVYIPIYDEHPDLGTFATTQRCHLSTGDIIEVDESGKGETIEFHGEYYTYYISLENIEWLIKTGRLIPFSGYEDILLPIVERKYSLEQELEALCENYTLEEESYGAFLEQGVQHFEDIMTNSIYRSMSNRIASHITAYCDYMKKRENILFKLRMSNFELESLLKSISAQQNLLSI